MPVPLWVLEVNFTDSSLCFITYMSVCVPAALHFDSVLTAIHAMGTQDAAPHRTQLAAV